MIQRHFKKTIVLDLKITKRESFKKEKSFLMKMPVLSGGSSVLSFSIGNLKTIINNCSVLCISGVCVCDRQSTNYMPGAGQEIQPPSWHSLT